MADPVIEQIASDLKAAANTVTTDNGYNQDFECVRPDRPDWENMPSPDNGTVILLQGEAENVDSGPISSTGRIVQYNESFTFLGFIIQSDSATDELDLLVNRARADLEKAIQQDPQRNGLAIDTAVMGSSRFDYTQSTSGFALVVSINYRTLKDDPYSAR